MKKRFLSLFLVLVLLCSLSIGASAESINGDTSGGLYGVLECMGTLTIDKLYATGTTWSSWNEEDMWFTRVTFYYIDGMGNNAYQSGTGRGYASVQPWDIRNHMAAIEATSYHEVDGDSRFGFWSASLTEYA